MVIWKSDLLHQQFSQAQILMRVEERDRKYKAQKLPYQHGNAGNWDRNLHKLENLITTIT